MQGRIEQAGQQNVGHGRTRQGRAGQGRKVKGAPGSKQAGQAGQLAAGFSCQPFKVPVEVQGFYSRG